MSTARQITRLTPEKYLQFEMNCDYRNEYYGGEIFAMTGGTLTHSLIISNVLSEVRQQLKGRPCVAYDGNLRIKTPSGLYAYPDTSVICSKPEFDDEFSHTVTNPTVLIEVLSKSTEAYDRGKKFTHYRSIPSFREYVLVSQDAPMVQTFLRNADETWTMDAFSEMTGVVALKSLGIALRMSEIYDRVDFESESETGLTIPPA